MPTPDKLTYNPDRLLFWQAEAASRMALAHGVIIRGCAVGDRVFVETVRPEGAVYGVLNLRVHTGIAEVGILQVCHMTGARTAPDNARAIEVDQPATALDRWLQSAGTAFGIRLQSETFEVALLEVYSESGDDPLVVRPKSSVIRTGVGASLAVAVANALVAESLPTDWPASHCLAA